MRPSFVTPTLYPCRFPRSVTASSTMLGFPSILFTTSCSQPEDFVKTRTVFSFAASSRFESASPAPVSAAPRRNSLRLELDNRFMKFPSVVSFGMLATGELFKNAVLGPSQLAHPCFRGVIRAADPSLQVFKVPAKTGILFSLATGCAFFRRLGLSIRQQRILFATAERRESLSESFLRLRFERRKRIHKTLPVLSRVHAQKQINEAVCPCLPRSRNDCFGKRSQRFFLLRIEEEWLPICGRKLLCLFEHRAIGQVRTNRMRSR